MTADDVILLPNPLRRKNSASANRQSAVEKRKNQKTEAQHPFINACLLEEDVNARAAQHLFLRRGASLVNRQ